MDKVYKLILFDLNGTIVNTPFIDHQPLHILSGRQEKLAALSHQGLITGVCTNQGGPIWRAATGKTNFPTATDVANECKAIITQLLTPGHFWCISLYDKRAKFLLHRAVEQEIADAAIMGSEPVYSEADTVLAGLKEQMEQAFLLWECPVSIWVGADKDWRKPEPGMLTFARNLVGTEATETLYVGDLPDDEQAAKNAGCDFMWADEFFDDKGKVG